MAGSLNKVQLIGRLGADPDKPVITTNLSFGISKEMFFKLCSFAPLINIFFNIFFHSLISLILYLSNKYAILSFIH